MTFTTFFEEDELKLLFYSVILFYDIASVFQQETQLWNLKTSHRSFHEMLSQEMGMSNYVIGCRERETSQILRDISFI